MFKKLLLGILILVLVSNLSYAQNQQIAPSRITYSVFTDKAGASGYQIKEGEKVILNQVVSPNSDRPEKMAGYVEQKAQEAVKSYRSSLSNSLQSQNGNRFNALNPYRNGPTPLAVCTTFNGALLAGDLTMGTRLSRPGAATGSCALAYAVPATIAGGPFLYDTYSWTNTGGAACITTTLTTTDVTNANIQFGMYTGSFVPANMVTNYLADPGLSTGTPAPAAGIACAVTVPAGATIVFVVFSTNPNTAASGTAAQYTLTVDGCTAVCVPPTASVLSQVGGAATTLINEPFDIAVPLPANWASKNNSTTVGTTGWFQGNPASFVSHSGATNSYIAANFNNTTGANTISNWLMTPNITLTNGDKFSFWTRTTTGTFPDRLQVRQSLNGASVNCGTLSTDVGDFSTLLLDINPTLTGTGYPTAWTLYTVTIAGLGAPTSGRLAFRYFVTGGGPGGANSDYIGIDDVLYTGPASPPPSTCTGSTANLVVNITGGVSPYTVVYSNGVTNTTVTNYISGTNIPVTPLVTTTYSLVSVASSGGCFGTGNSGTPTVVVATCCVTPATASICPGQIVQLQTPQTVTSGTQTFTSTVPITIPAGAPTTTVGPATPYPSTITVSGLPTTGVTVKSITLNGITHTFPTDIDAVVQSPTAVNVVVMSDVGGTAAPAAPLNYTFDDAAATSLTAAASPSGTYKPSNVGAADTWVAPGPGALTQAAPVLSDFVGNPNGVWNLYIVDDVGGDVGSMTGWSITFNVQSSTGTPAVWTNVTNPTYTSIFTDNLATVAYTGTPLSTVWVKPAVNSTFRGTFASGACAATVNQTVVTLKAAPTITVGPNNLCAPATLTAAGGTTYSWAPATGLSATTGATVIANPSVNTVYTVTGTLASSGCFNTATANVNATPQPPTIFPNPAAACLGTPLALSANSPGPVPTTVTFTSPNFNANVPDNNLAAVTNTLAVSGIPTGAIITDISVKMNAVSTWMGDLVITLKAPNNGILNLDYCLAQTNGGATGGAGFTNTNVGASYTTLFSAGVSPWTGNFKADLATAAVYFGAPPGPNGYLPTTALWSDLYGTPNGNWTLAFADVFPGGDVTTFQNWSISITYSPPVAVNAVWSPITNLWTNAGATTAYTAGTPISTVYTTTPTNTTYTAIINTGTCSSLPSTVAVTVNIPVAITLQPVNATVCTDKVTSFTAAASGTTPSHNWQVKPTGSTVWVDVVASANYAGEKTGTLTITTPPPSWNGYLFRDSVTGAAPCVYRLTNVVTLTVNPLPTVVLSANPYLKLFPGLRSTLSVASNPAAATYSWFKNGSPFSGSTTATYVADVDAMGTYYVRVVDVNGCVNTSNSITISDSVSGRVFIYPSPNGGQFQVRYYSVPGNELPRSLTVFDSKGARVLTQMYAVGRPYDRMDVDLRNVGSGVYRVELGDRNGVRIITGTVVVLR